MAVVALRAILCRAKWTSRQPPVPPAARRWQHALRIPLSSMAQLAGASAGPTASEPRFVIVAVSGTLQDGFPLRKNLDYGEHAADFIGWALCRGMKSYFDVKDAGCREHVPPGAAPTVNPAIVATGNPLHANLYAVYAVHESAALNALLNEPRFLSMTPDTAKIDLTAEETSPEVKALCTSAIGSASAELNANEVALLTVVSTVRAETFVENPPLYTKADGTSVTNFHDGLAKLCGTTDAARVSEPEAYYAAVTDTLRRLEKAAGWSDILGTDRRTLRMNRRYTKSELSALRQSAEDTGTTAGTDGSADSPAAPVAASADSAESRGVADGSAAPKAYVLVNNVVHDKDNYAEYIKLITPTVAEFGGRYLVRGGPGPDTLGDAWEWSRVVLMEFETMERARSWATDPEIVPLHDMRKKYAKSEMVIFEGTVTGAIS